MVQIRNAQTQHMIRLRRPITARRLNQILGLRVAELEFRQFNRLQLSKSAPVLPGRLWLARHAESAGNVAREAALASGAATIAIEGRDADVALSNAGRRQARALGEYFARSTARPDVILASPYLRARETAEQIALQAEVSPDCVRFDERLREKEFGIIDGLTRTGIEQRYPDVAASRTSLGKFYHRPPGGESWCDVILRVRSVLASLSLEYEGKNVVIVTHQVVVLCARYILENMDEAAILSIDREGDVMNGAITEYARENGILVLKRYNWVAPIAKTGAPVTSELDQARTS